MHGSATAYESLAQLTVEIKADLMLISEQYMNRDPASWHPDLPNIAAIWVRDGAFLKSLPGPRGWLYFDSMFSCNFFQSLSDTERDNAALSTQV